MNTRLLYTLPATALSLVALALAVAGFLTVKAPTPAPSDTEKAAEARKPSTPEYRYLVATRALSAGELLSGAAFTTVVSSNVVPDAISADDAPFGKPVKSAVAPGELLTLSKLESSSLLQRLVAPGYQALAVPVDDVSGVGGLLRPGDRVDVTASFRRSDKDEPAALRMLKDVLVLAVRGVPRVGDALEPEERRRNSTVVLAVPEDKVPELLLASTEGMLRLAAIAAPAEALAGHSDVVPAGQHSGKEAETVYMTDLFPLPAPTPPHQSSAPDANQVQVFEGSESRYVYVR